MPGDKKNGPAEKPPEDKGKTLNNPKGVGIGAQNTRTRVRGLVNSGLTGSKKR